MGVVWVPPRSRFLMTPEPTPCPAAGTACVTETVQLDEHVYGSEY